MEGHTGREQFVQKRDPNLFWVVRENGQTC
jgi:hypothetical protein